LGEGGFGRERRAKFTGCCPAIATAHVENADAGVRARIFGFQGENGAEFLFGLARIVGPQSGLSPLKMLADVGTWRG
jgi:hypothetical protein